MAVYKGIRAAGEATSLPPAKPSAGVVQIDGLWHFVNGKKQGSDLAGL